MFQPLFLWRSFVISDESQTNENVLLRPGYSRAELVACPLKARKPECGISDFLFTNDDGLNLIDFTL